MPQLCNSLIIKIFIPPKIDAWQKFRMKIRFLFSLFNHSNDYTWLIKPARAYLFKSQINAQTPKNKNAKIEKTNLSMFEQAFLHFTQTNAETGLWGPPPIAIVGEDCEIARAHFAHWPRSFRRFPRLTSLLSTTLRINVQHTIIPMLKYEFELDDIYDEK